MHTITIEVKWNVMKVHDGKLKRARLTWTAPGVEVYVIGTLQGGLYEQAANLAMNWCENYHIPPRSLRRAGRGYEERKRDEKLTSDSGLSLRKKLL